MPKLHLDLPSLADLPLENHSDEEILAAIEDEIKALKKVLAALQEAAETIDNAPAESVAGKIRPPE